MKAYVINLDRAAERWGFVSGLCAERGLVFERVAAVDGAALPEAEFEALRAGSLGLRPLLRAEVACFESHKAVWRRIVEGGEDWALVLEDDIFLAQSVARICDGIIAAGTGFDLVKLNAYARPVLLAERPAAVIEGRGVHRVLARSSDSSAYLIRRDAAARALELHARYAEAVDLALFDPASGMALGLIVPSVSVQAKMADFGFLSAEATQGEIQARREKTGGVLGALNGELRRIWRRRIAPLGVPLGNLVRGPEARRVLRRVDFAE